MESLTKLLRTIILQFILFDHRDDAHKFWKMKIKYLLDDDLIYQYGFYESVKINIYKKISTIFDCVGLKKSVLLIPFKIYYLLVNHLVSNAKNTTMNDIFLNCG